jgi:hypothetical protein
VPGRVGFGPMGMDELPLAVFVEGIDFGAVPSERNSLFDGEQIERENGHIFGRLDAGVEHVVFVGMDFTPQGLEHFLQELFAVQTLIENGLEVADLAAHRGDIGRGIADVPFVEGVFFDLHDFLFECAHVLRSGDYAADRGTRIRFYRALSVGALGVGPIGSEGNDHSHNEHGCDDFVHGDYSSLE